MFEAKLTEYTTNQRPGDDLILPSREARRNNFYSHISSCYYINYGVRQSSFYDSYDAPYAAVSTITSPSEDLKYDNYREWYKL